MGFFRGEMRTLGDKITEQRFRRCCGSFRGLLFPSLHFSFLIRARYKLNALRQLIERGQLKPVIDSMLPLEKVAEAHRRLEAGGVRGKLVLKVAE